MSDGRVKVTGKPSKYFSLTTTSYYKCNLPGITITDKHFYWSGRWRQNEVLDRSMMLIASDYNEAEDENIFMI